MRVLCSILCREWNSETALLNILVFARVVIVANITCYIPWTILGTFVIRDRFRTNRSSHSIRYAFEHSTLLL